MKFGHWEDLPGGAVVNQIAENGKSKELVRRAGKFMKSLADA